jgi:hypothetical protein
LAQRLGLIISRFDHEVALCEWEGRASEELNAALYVWVIRAEGSANPMHVCMYAP